MMKRYWIIGIILIIGCGCTVNPAERNNAGNNLYDQADYVNAIKAYQAAQVAAPDGPEAYFNAASAYSRAGEYDKAIEALKQALKTTDSDLANRAYYNLGNVYFELHRFDDAIMAYQQALLLHPEDQDARHNLELALQQIVATSTPTSAAENATEEIGSDSPTPTNEPVTSEEPTALNDGSDLQTSSPMPPPNSSEVSSTYSVEDAQRMLDAVQQSQPMFPNQAITDTPSSPNSGKDW